jgi:hypothetical protein
MHGHIHDLATGNLDVGYVSASMVRYGLNRHLGRCTTYWSKKGSKTMTSSPSSMNAMNALSMPTSWGVSSAPSLRNQHCQPTFIRTRRDGDLGLRVKLPSPERRIGVGNRLFQPWPALGRAVLVALHPVQRSLCRVQDELWWVVAEESLAHVYDRLVRRGCGSLVDYSPDAVSVGSSEKGQ